MLTAQQFASLSFLAWDCNGEALARSPIRGDAKVLVDHGLAFAKVGEEWTTLVLTPKGLRQLAS
jgi:hypothetical protein